MKSAIVLISALIAAITGCSSVEHVELAQKERWLPGAQRELLNSDVSVTTRGGYRYEGKMVRLTGDSLWLVGTSRSTRNGLELDEVSSIRPSRSYGAPIGGFLGGVLVGALVGNAIGFRDATEQTGPIGQFFERTANSWAGAILGAAVGGAVGAAVLGLASSVTDYEIFHSPTYRDPSQPASPDSLLVPPR